MNKYIAFYKNRQIEVEAETSYKAQLKAAAIFKARQSYQVTVVLVEKDGQEVLHDAAEF